MLGKVVEHIGLGLEILVFQHELLGLFVANPALERLDHLFEVNAVVFKMWPLITGRKIVDLWDSFVLLEGCLCLG